MFGREDKSRQTALQDTCYSIGVFDAGPKSRYNCHGLRRRHWQRQQQTAAAAASAAAAAALLLLLARTLFGQKVLPHYYRNLVCKLFA
jgi:hypothetical protein